MLSILGRMEQGLEKYQPDNPEMPQFVLRQAVNGWVVQVQSRWGTEEYLTEVLGEASEKFRSLAERWEKVLHQMTAKEPRSAMAARDYSASYDRCVSESNTVSV